MLRQQSCRHCVTRWQCFLIERSQSIHGSLGYLHLLFCRAFEDKRQWLLTLQVNSYCLLALQILHYDLRAHIVHIVVTDQPYRLTCPFISCHPAAQMPSSYCSSYGSIHLTRDGNQRSFLGWASVADGGPNLKRHWVNVCDSRVCLITSISSLCYMTLFCLFMVLYGVWSYCACSQGRAHTLNLEVCLQFNVMFHPRWGYEDIKKNLYGMRRW